MAESRQFSGNTLGDHASIFQGNITNVTNNFDADDAAADKAFLRKFSKTNPIDNKNRILESKGDLLDKSYRWILQHEQFTKWCNPENSGVLWIKGDPGKGKTMLLCGIIKEFEKDSKMQERLAYFFCQGTDNKINTSTAIIRGLIYIFLRQYPKLVSRIQEENKGEPDDFLEGDNERFALCRIFKSVTEDPCITGPICVLDALDECQHEESLQSLFSLIVDTSSRVKWLLSSRNEKWIERGLRAVKEHQRLTLELGGNSEHVSNAVKTYIGHCIQDIHALKDDAELRHKTADVLHAKANGTFLWVTLVVKELNNTSHPHVEAVLQSMPEDLKELYDEILRRGKKRWKADERACLATLATVTAAKRPLSMEELHMFISPTLIQLEGKHNIHSVKGFVEACGSFISNTNDVVYFIHQSVKDYMVQKTNRAVFPSGIADQHFIMFEISISEMNKTLKRNEYPIKESPIGQIYEVIPSGPRPYTPIEYYCAFWIEHLVEGCESQQTRLQECLKNKKQLHIFINQKYLYWLEAMIRLQSMTQAIEALQKLHTLIIRCCASESEVVQGYVSLTPASTSLTRVFSWISRVTGLAFESDGSGERAASQILELTKDLHRAISDNRAMIERLPTQIYVAVSAFSPTKSRLRKTFETAESPKWLTTKPVVREEWGACLLERPFESSLRFVNLIRFLTFSPDNSKLASIIGISRFIEVWDLATRVPLQNLDNESATNAAFSSNGNTLALCSPDNIEIWDLVSRSLLRKIYRTGITSVSFIAGDTHLSILGPRFFAIHDITKNVDLHAYFCRSGEQFHDVVVSSGYIQQALCGIHDSVEAWDMANWTLVPYFANKTFGARLVVTRKQETSTLLKVVDPDAGKYTQTTLIHEGDLDTLFFSLTSDGMRLVVLYRHEMILVWDLATGFQQKIDIGDKRLKKAAFSPCRMLLALANDEDIFVWNVASGEYRWASTGHADDTAALAFSPDGSRLALGTNNGTIKLWGMTASEPLQNPEIRPDAIIEMVYSPSGNWLASLSCSGIKLWDPITGECLRTWRTSSNFTALAFSLDSGWLVAGDDKGTIHVYDVATGACHQTLPSAEYGDSCIGSSDRSSPKTSIDSMAFSSNGSTLASVEPKFRTLDVEDSFDYTLKTWDLATGQCLQAVTLSGREKLHFGIARLIFSPSNTQLGSILRNGTAIVWDASTGKLLQTLMRREPLYYGYQLNIPGLGEDSMRDKFADSLTRISAYFSRTEGLEHSNKEPELSISEDNKWILWKKEHKVGLPLEYRPRIFAAHANFCAIATYGHQVLCFRFSFG